MTQYIFPPAPVVSLPIKGSAARFPVRRIFCVGRNYAAHAAEMGFTVDKATAQPFYFTKSLDAVLLSGSKMPYALGTQNFHYEMELVIAIGAPAFRVSEEEAAKAIFGYACGLDMTRRDLQFAARDKGLPWDIAKDVEQGAVLSEIVPFDQVGLLTQGAVTLKVNDEVKQQGNLNQLIWSIPELIAHLSRFYHLQPGDLLYTGTPEGVGPVKPGDRLQGQVEGVGSISVEITAAE